MNKALTLLDLNLLVKNRLKRDFPDTFWVQAEISECKEHYSGHCYLELVQKRDGSDVLCAKVRATIWVNTWQPLKQRFRDLTGTTLQAGQKILSEVQVDFHELYGFSLVIRDIDPTYTLGDLNLRRQEVIRQLTRDGVIGLNKELSFPDLPQRIAVVSSPTAAGYEDFMHQLTCNDQGLVFYVSLFPAIMQGEAAVPSILAALDRVLDSGIDFDLVVLIRGGGASADLSCFDQYDLCYYCAQLPLPLVTGIGHDRDVSVLDMVAHTSVKTPTAAAEHLLARMNQEAWRLENNADRLQQVVLAFLDREKQRLLQNSSQLRSVTAERMQLEHIKVERLRSGLQSRSELHLNACRQRVNQREMELEHQSLTLLDRQKHRIELLESRLASHSPEVMIQRGFTLTLHQGRIVKSVHDLQPGDVLQTRLKDGNIESIIEKIHTNHE